MPSQVSSLIVGQGLAGSALAWTLHWAGQGVTIVDRSEENSASRVAAGLVTPVTGKRLVRSSDYDADWAAAVAFYRRVESETGLTLFEERPMLRLFADAATRSAFVERSDAVAVREVELWEGYLQSNGRRQQGIVMRPAGRLNVLAYLAATRLFFETLGAYRQTDLNLRRDVQVAAESISVPRLNLTAHQMILCQGSTTSDLFPGVPNNPARGDILTVRLPDYVRREVVHRSVWIAPNPDGTQTVGATYDWKSPVAEPKDSGRQEVLDKLHRMVDGDIVIDHHRAGVRPSMKDYEAVLGRHPAQTNVFVFNGLGSKGTLKAPRLAAELQQWMVDDVPIPARRNYERLKVRQPENQRARPLTQQAQDAVASVLQPGDTVVDATVGNGFDTCFLSRSVGPAGHVFGFDIQQTALDATHRRLHAEDLHNVTLLHQGHETLRDTLAGTSLSAVMFNLGFLPRSDHHVTTQPATSVLAIEAAIGLLKPGGVLTVVAYRGHSGGPEEFDAVEQCLQTYADRHQLQRIDSSPAKPTAPVLFVLRRIPDC
ncbi:MAG: FAD-dependent oxidoreductase [Planctomycetaceae bacterium]